MPIKTIGNMTRRPLDQMTPVQQALAAACDQLNGIVSDLHYLAHEATADEAQEGLYQWSEDWGHRMATTRTKIDEANQKLSPEYKAS